jgi:multidrug resistance efflux pump
VWSPCCRVVRHPQTDDAIVVANIIGVVPQVSGTIVELHVADNQVVKAGELLFLIDPRPYELAVRRARRGSRRSTARSQRRIDGQQFASPRRRRRYNAGRRKRRTRTTASGDSSRCWRRSS